LSGDVRLTPGQRLAWLLANAGRNLQAGASMVQPVPGPSLPADAGAPGSPARALTDAYLLAELPRLLPRRPLNVLEIGCGSGSFCALLARLGYTGTYTGLDIGDRFNRAAVPGFSKTFMQQDVHAFAGEGAYDLIYSNSALEHIPAEQDLPRRLGARLAPGGLQLHIVPAPWALPLYLWHGYRQYPPAALAARFDPVRTEVHRLGGPVAFLVHFLCITLLETLLRVPFRQALPGLYRALLAACRIDRLFGQRPAIFYVVRERAP
jgi:SAM-dependent methyltransferase